MTKVEVVAIASFEGVRIGDQGLVTMTPRLEAIIRLGYLKVVGGSGKTKNRSGGDSRSVKGSRDSGVDSGVPVGDEPSEDPDSS